jgi:drug/metabolite transporter (DMT)-like permease
MLSIVSDFVFIQLFKFSQRKGYHAPIVVATNYLVVAVTLSAFLLLRGEFTFSDGAIRTGLMTGIVFISSLSIMTRVMDSVAVGAVLTAFRISIVVPIVLGVCVWGEPLALEQVGGILLTLAALLLMTSGAGRSKTLTGIKTFGLLMAVFLVQGGSHSCLRSVHYTGLDNEFVQVILLTGATAGTIGAIFVALNIRVPRRPELAMGATIGFYNAVVLCIVMIALSKMPGTLFFPIMGCSVVVLDNLAAHFVWKERLNRLAGVGVGVAVLGIVLVI